MEADNTADADDDSDVHSARRRGYIPDLRMHLPPRKGEGGGAVQARLLEVKTIMGKSRYNSAATRDVRAVDTRAANLHNEYARKLHQKDVNWCGTAEDEKGPMQTVLESHGQLRGLIFGSVGEASKEVHELITIFSRASAAAMVGDGEAAGAATSLIGRFAWQLRRTIAMTHWRALGNLIIDRKRLLLCKGEAQRNEMSGMGSCAQETAEANRRQESARQGHQRQH